jgi:hypothetical protein
MVVSNQLFNIHTCSLSCYTDLPLCWLRRLPCRAVNHGDCASIPSGVRIAHILIDNQDIGQAALRSGFRESLMVE